MTQHASDRGMLWVALLTVALTIVAAIVTVASFSGRLDARVSSLESATRNSVSRDEWKVFEQDVRDRLDRIESKLDAHDARR